MSGFVIVEDYLLKELVEKYIEELIDNLIEMDKVASGNLINNITYRISSRGKVKKIRVIYPDYLVNVDRGTKPGHFPPPSVIRKWIDDKRIEIYGDRSKDSVAYAISRKIYKKGIKATNVIRDANSGFDVELIQKGVFRSVKKIINGFKLDFGKGRRAAQ